MGSQVPLDGGIALRADLPDSCEIRLLKDGRPVQIIAKGQVLTHSTRDIGTYRIEAYRRFRGQRRAWIFSNPIYVT